MENGELARIRELLQVSVAVQLQDRGIPQGKIAKVVRKSTIWVNALLKQTNRSRKDE